MVPFLINYKVLFGSLILFCSVHLFMHLASLQLTLYTVIQLPVYMYSVWITTSWPFITAKEKKMCLINLVVSFNFYSTCV